MDGWTTLGTLEFQRLPSTPGVTKFVVVGRDVLPYRLRITVLSAQAVMLHVSHDGLNWTALDSGDPPPDLPFTGSLK